MATTLRALGRRVLSACVPAVMLLVTSQASASVIYTYTGNAFDQFSSAGYPPSTYSSTNYVSVTLEVSAPLGPNLVFAGATPLSFIVSDGLNTIAKSDASSSGFAFSTNGSGAIVNWAVAVEDYRQVNGSWLMKTIRTINDPARPVVDRGNYQLCGPNSNSQVCAIQSGDITYGADGSRASDPGTWRLQTTQPPTVPEPTSLLLLGTGLVGVLARRRRQ